MYEYKSQEELYVGLLPALNVRIKYFKRSKVNDITRDDIWNYLKETKWKNSIDLTLADMVQDILHIDGKEILDYRSKNKKALFY